MARFAAGDLFPFKTDLEYLTERFCWHCGRPVKGGYFGVEVIDGGYIREQDGTVADLEDPGYMGFYEVGSTCAEKFDPRVLVKP